MTHLELDYRLVFERSGTGVCRFDTTGRIFDCNSALARILGYSSREELLEKGEFDFVNESDGALILAALRDLGAVHNIDVPVRRRDGSVAWICQNAALVTEPNGSSYFDAVVMETSEQREAAQRF